MSDFAKTKAMFHIPEGMIYLDGNSLGAMPWATAVKVERTITDEWGDMLITGWNKAGWMAKPTDIGDRIGRLIGAEKGSVVMGDTLSIKVYQAVASALEMNPGRKVVLSDNGNFPTDLYMADGLCKTMGADYEVRTVNPEAVEAALSEDIAVLMLTEIDYRTGRKHDMKALTEKAQALGIITIWDLAHSAGALPVDLAGCNADFAVGCTYKYLNSGPGGPAFIYVAPRHQDVARPALSGWLGHDAPFAFDLDYRPGAGIERMRVGTPPILQLAALEASMDIWDQVDIHDIRKASIALCEQFIAGVEESCPALKLASPRNADDRGSQVSFRHPEGYAIMQAMIARNVIGDFRAPDIIRFGFTPLYIDESDVAQAISTLKDVMENDLWDKPEYKIKSRVT